MAFVINIIVSPINPRILCIVDVNGRIQSANQAGGVCFLEGGIRKVFPTVFDSGSTGACLLCVSGFLVVIKTINVID